MAEETVEFIGCLKIPDGVIHIDWLKLSMSDLIKDACGITRCTPYVIKRASNDFDLIGLNGTREEKLNAMYASLVASIISYVEKNRIPGKLVLYFEKVQLQWDVKLICTVYRKNWDE